MSRFKSLFSDYGHVQEVSDIYPRVPKDYRCPTTIQYGYRSSVEVPMLLVTHFLAIITVVA